MQIMRYYSCQKMIPKPSTHTWYKNCYWYLPLFLAGHNANALITLKTKTQIPNTSTKEVYNYLATSKHWPEIVWSSFGVEGDRTEVPMKKDDTVDEIFGLPILPLRVSWKCAVSDERRGVLDMISTDGVPGLATDCRMLFEISDKTSTTTQQQGTEVILTMEYESTNALGNLAIPILTLDNTLALKVLLPAAITKSSSQQRLTPLHEFEKLMGSLYGVAGLVHFYDCLFGDSTLLVAAGAAGYFELLPVGQSLVLLWCAMGPVAFALSRLEKVSGGGLGLGTAGLVSYGVVEVVLAAVVNANSVGSVDINPLINAIGVQIAVAVSWIYASHIASEETGRDC